MGKVFSHLNIYIYDYDFLGCFSLPFFSNRSLLIYCKNATGRVSRSENVGKECILEY